MSTAEEGPAGPARQGPGSRELADEIKGRLVGIDFVDLLFALVVFELIEPLRDPGKIVLVGWWHLAVGLTLTFLSWIGYHASPGAVNEFRIKAPEPPFWHLLLDVAMVIAYWLTAVTYERNAALTNEVHAWWSVHEPSAVPEAALVLATFVLYVVWDQLARYIHTSWHGVNAEDRWDEDRKVRYRRRNYPTFVGVVVAAILLLVAIAKSDTTRWVVAVDVALIALLFSFRFGKECISQGGRTSERRIRSQRWGLLIAVVVGLSWLGVNLIRDLA